MITLVVMGIYTFIIVYGIHHYEAKIKDLQAAISDYQRALNIARNKPSDGHYTYLQLENNRQKDQIRTLDLDNELLKKQNKELKAQLAGDQQIQYEFSTYKSNTWESSNYETTIKENQV